MKNLITLALLILALSAYGQVPQGFSFQGIAFDEDGLPLVEVEIDIRAEILEGDINSPPIYTEEHSTTTSSKGLYSLVIGKGDPTVNTFENIDWTVIPKYISISISVDGDDFTNVGTTELMSVPYALVAGRVENTPAINVRLLNPNWTLPLYSTGGNSNAYVLYNYQWISGTPENVLVDYTNAPAGVTLGINETPGWAMPGFPISYRNTSLVDTIRDGIMPNRATFGADSQNPPNSGYYEFPVYFKTESGVLLDSMKLNLQIKGGLFDDCIEFYSGTKTATSTDCEELEHYLNHDITFSNPISFNTIPVYNILNLGTDNEVYFTSCEYTNLSHALPSIYGPDFMETYSEISVDSEGLYIEIVIIFSSTGDYKTCKIRYE